MNLQTRNYLHLAERWSYQINGSTCSTSSNDFSQDVHNMLSNEGPRFLVSRQTQPLKRILVRKQNIFRRRKKDSETESYSQWSSASTMAWERTTSVGLREKSIFDSDYTIAYSETWPCKDQIKKPNLYKLLWQNVEQHANTDVAIKIGNVVFKCHSLILHCYTQHFIQNERQKSTKLFELNMPTLSFMMLYKWMITKSIETRHRDILQLYIAADFLDIEELKDQCSNFINDSTLFTEHFAYELYKDCTTHGVLKIRQLMLPRISKFFLTLVATTDFLEMETDDVCQWLSSNSIGVNCEMEVLYAAVLWLNYKWCKRQGIALKKVISCVRFQLIPPWFLISLNSTTKNEHINRIFGLDAVKKFIADGLSYTTTLLFYSQNRPELSKKKNKRPAQRRWLYDKSCPYHYREQTTILQHINYESFNQYLLTLRQFGKNYWQTLEETTEDHWMYLCSLRPSPGDLNLVEEQ